MHVYLYIYIYCIYIYINKYNITKQKLHEWKKQNVMVSSRSFQEYNHVSKSVVIDTHNEHKNSALSGHSKFFLEVFIL